MGEAPGLLGFHPPHFGQYAPAPRRSPETATSSVSLRSSKVSGMRCHGRTEGHVGGSASPRPGAVAGEVTIPGGRLGTPVQLVPEQARFLRALAGASESGTRGCAVNRAGGLREQTR